jgi:FAD/FMN-containing dehydrogenase
MPAEQPRDVAAAVQLARERQLRITVRSGGHGWWASHLRDEVLLIDVSRLADISIDAAARAPGLDREPRAGT